MQLTSEESKALTLALKEQDREILDEKYPVFVRPINEKISHRTLDHSKDDLQTHKLSGYSKEHRRFGTRYQASRCLFVGDIVEVNTGYWQETAIQAMVVGQSDAWAGGTDQGLSNPMRTKLKVLFRSVGDGGPWKQESAPPTPFVWETYFTNIRKLNGVLIFDQEELSVIDKLNTTLSYQTS